MKTCAQYGAPPSQNTIPTPIRSNPEHQTALARAASVQQLMACYPLLQGMVAPAA